MILRLPEAVEDVTWYPPALNNPGIIMCITGGRFDPVSRRFDAGKFSTFWARSHEGRSEGRTSLGGTTKEVW